MFTFMAQRSVTTQTTLTAESQPITLHYRWMRFFFAENTSATSQPIVALQQRAVWISIALLLQALNEIDHAVYFPFLAPFGSLIPLALLVGSFVAIWMAFRPASKQQQRSYRRGQVKRWQRLLLILTFGLTIFGGIEFGRTLIMVFLPPQFSNDGTSLDTNAAMLVLQGRNPYTDSNMLDMVRRFNIQPNWTTPLRLGQFANRLDYPTQSDSQTVLDTDLKGNYAPEFESKVSYPALSFLTLILFAIFKDYNVLPLYLLSYLLLVWVAWKAAQPQLRPWVLLLSMANVSMWTSTVGGNLDIFCMLLIVLAWLLRDKRWLSLIFLGLAIATKQTSWFYIPFYAIMIWQFSGFKEMLYRLSGAGLLALLINLPFIVWNPQAWMAGIMAPVADPMFPMGVGIVDLSITHLIPFLPQGVYTALEAIAMVFSLVWYWRICRRYPEAAMLLAVLPLFFAWRSLPSYFYCAAFPLFILMVAKIKTKEAGEAEAPALKPTSTRMPALTGKL